MEHIEIHTMKYKHKFSKSKKFLPFYSFDYTTQMAGEKNVNIEYESFLSLNVSICHRGPSEKNPLIYTSVKSVL